MHGPPSKIWFGRQDWWLSYAYQEGIKTHNEAFWGQNIPGRVSQLVQNWPEGAERDWLRVLLWLGSGTEIRSLPESCTHNFCWYPLGQKLAVWTHPTAGEVTKCSLYSKSSCAQFSTGVLLLYNKGRVNIRGQKPVSNPVTKETLDRITSIIWSHLCMVYYSYNF